MSERFNIHIREQVLDDLRSRIAATRWPPHLDDLGWRYGFDGTYLRDLAASWCTDFDWRTSERRIRKAITPTNARGSVYTATRDGAGFVTSRSYSAGNE